jgi:TatD DNase family protein
MELIDTHCHLDFAEFSQDRNEVLEQANHAGVTVIVVPGVKRNSWDTLIAVCDQSPSLFYALGLHPMFIDEHLPAHVDSLREYLMHANPVAVGEIGLDYQNKNLNSSLQVELFTQQLLVAQEFNLPVILHVRKAHDEVLTHLKNFPVVGGIVHAFNGSMQQAEKYQELNFKFGFGGMLTFERSAKLRTLAKQLPLDSIVLETDAPDMTVMQHRGERNSPAYLPYCLQALAEVKAMDVEQVAVCTSKNARATLGIA